MKASDEGLHCFCSQAGPGFRISGVYGATTTASRGAHTMKQARGFGVTIRSVCGCLVLACASLASVSAKDPEVLGPPAEMSAAAERSIASGLEYLAKHQHGDGYWIEMIGRKVNEEYRGSLGRHVGVTALAGMAFLSNGSTPGRGRYGDNVRRAVAWLLEQVQADDGFATADHSRMYSHAFATLFLAEVYGMSGGDSVRDGLVQAIDRIVTGQNEQGGWRYMPGAPDSDMSITVTCVMALRGARNVGIHVPSETIDAAIAYVKRSHIGGKMNPRLRGGFYYQAPDNSMRMSRTSFALTAAGVTALYGAGEYDAPEARAGLHAMLRGGETGRPQAWRMHQSFDYFYGHYYAVQAFYQAGGSYWAQWFPIVRDEIVAGQHKGGYWEDLVGRNYATAMATIILQIPYRYLPIFER